MATKKKSVRRARPVAALLVFVAGLFLLLGRRCGLLGGLLAAVSDVLVGHVGTAILVLTAFVVSIILIVPEGAFMRLLPRRQKKIEKPRAFGGGAVAAHFETLGRRTKSAYEDLKLKENLKDVRAVLKHLGYTKGEYEPLLAMMDPNLPSHALIREALRSLQVN